MELHSMHKPYRTRSDQETCPLPYTWRPTWCGVARRGVAWRGATSKATNSQLQESALRLTLNLCFLLFRWDLTSSTLFFPL